MDDKKYFYALCFLNNSNAFHAQKGWVCANVYDHYPTFDELMKTELLGTGYVADMRMARMLTNGFTTKACITYSESHKSMFFEVAVYKFEYGEDMNLYDLFVTGYAVHDKSLCIEWTDERIH